MISLKSILYRKRHLLRGIILIPFFAASYYRLDPDFGWHIKAGEYISTHGIPHHDIFTYTASDFLWINHEWLNDLIIFSINDLGGYFLVSLFFALLWTSAIFLASRKTNIFAMTFATLAILPYVGIRPIVWSLVLFAVLERIIESRLRKKKIILPMLFFIWANLHGGFFLGLVVLGISLLGKKISLSPFTLFISFLATLINPYGIRLYQEIIRTLLDGSLRFSVFEWQPFIFPAFSMFYISLLIALFLIVHKKDVRKIPFLPFFLFLISFSSTRHTPFFIISSLRYFEDYLSKLVKLIPKKLSGARHKSLLLLKLLALILLGYGFASAVLPRDREASYPKQAVSYLKANPCPGNLFNVYGHGGYLIWKLPGKKVYIDGRMPSWDSKEGKYLRRYGQVFMDEMVQKSEFKKYSIKCALLEAEDDKVKTGKEKSLSEKLQKDGWIKVIEDKKSILLIAR